GLRFAPGKEDADRTAGDEHAADQRDDQQRVLRKEAPAARHGTSRLLKSGEGPRRADTAGILTAFAGRSRSSRRSARPPAYRPSLASSPAVEPSSGAAAVRP